MFEQGIKPNNLDEDEIQEIVDSTREYNSVSMKHEMHEVFLRIWNIFEMSCSLIFDISLSGTFIFMFEVSLVLGAQIWFNHYYLVHGVLGWRFEGNSILVEVI